MASDEIKIDLEKDTLDLNPVKYRIQGEISLNQFDSQNKY